MMIHVALTRVFRSFRSRRRHVQPKQQRILLPRRIQSGSTRMPEAIDSNKDNNQVISSNTKTTEKKLRKALRRAVKQEETEGRKLHKTSVENQNNNTHIALLSPSALCEWNDTSELEMLAEIWAMRSSTLELESHEDAGVEFQFFAGCSRKSNARHSKRGQHFPMESYATTVPIKPTLVSNMPPLFIPRFFNRSYSK